MREVEKKTEETGDAIGFLSCVNVVVGLGNLAGGGRGMKRGEKEEEGKRGIAWVCFSKLL